MKIDWHDILDSTNSEAYRCLGTLDNMSVIAAEWQSSGRGQGDHKWHSEEGKNLTFTVVLKYSEAGAELLAADALYVTMITTFAIRRFLKSEGVVSRIKWPNDIYVGGKKICGILIENRLSGKNIASSIIGVGLNLNQTEFPDDLPNPVSLKQLTGITYEKKKVLEELSSYFGESQKMLLDLKGRELLREDFDSCVFRPAESV